MQASGSTGEAEGYVKNALDEKGFVHPEGWGVAFKSESVQTKRRGNISAFNASIARVDKNVIKRDMEEALQSKKCRCMYELRRCSFGREQHQR